MSGSLHKLFTYKGVTIIPKELLKTEEDYTDEQRTIEYVTSCEWGTRRWSITLLHLKFTEAKPALEILGTISKINGSYIEITSNEYN
jgi:hypothetical protein